MKSDKVISKLTKWALLFQEYNFEVVHYDVITNMDADGLSRDPSPLDKDLTRAR